MAHLQNLFSLLDSEEDSSTIIDAALAAVKAEKSEDKKKPSQKMETNTQPGTAHHPMMTKPNRNTHDLRPQHPSTKEKREGEKPERYGDYRKQTENQHPIANGNGHSNNGFPGNFNGAKPYNKHTNNSGNYGATNGFQGNSRRNFGGSNGYESNSRGANHYNRNHRYNANDLQGNVGGVNGQNTENVVDADGWQLYLGRHSRRKGGQMTPENQSQHGGDVQQVNEAHNRERWSGNNFNGGDRRGRRNRSNGTDQWAKVNNNGREESSDVFEKEQPQNDVPQAAYDGETIGVNEVESKNSESCGVEAGKDSNETNTATEEDKDSKEPKKSKKSRKDGHKDQDSSKMTKKKEDDENKIVFTLKEYEKAQLEKRKALDSLKQTEERKVFLDKDFGSMLLVDKRNEDKLNSGKEAVAKKKDSIKGEKMAKVMSIDEFLKPANGNGGWRRRRRFIEERKANGSSHDKDKLNDFDGEETKSHDNGNGSNADFAPIIADANQFPALRPNFKH